MADGDSELVLPRGGTSLEAKGHEKETANPARGGGQRHTDAVTVVDSKSNAADKPNGSSLEEKTSVK